MTTSHLPARTAAARRLAGAAALVAALGLASCGVLPDRAATDSSAGGAPPSTTSSEQAPDDTAGGAGGEGAGGGDEPPSDQVLGSSVGSPPASPLDSAPVPMRLDVRSVERLDGDVVEVRFALTHTGDGASFEPYSTLSGETDSPEGRKYDVSGAALLDLPADRRYLTLVDTEWNCLCTTFTSTGDSEIPPGGTVEMYAQFPAPPESTTAVDFALPGFQPVNGLEIR